MKFSHVVRDARIRAGLTQQDLARSIGIGPRAVWLIEQGGGTLKVLIPILYQLQIGISGLPPAITLAARLKVAREKRRLSLRTLAELSRVSVPTLRGLEAGVGRVASLEAVMAVLAPKIRPRAHVKRLQSAGKFSATRLTEATFVHGDCISEMQSMTPQLINLVVTSPPYNGGKEYEESLSLEGYLGFAERWVSCIPHLLTPTGALWINLGFTKVSETEAIPLTYLYYPILLKHGLRLIQEVVWHFESGMSAKRRFSTRTERWMWCVKDPQNYTFHLDDIRDPTLNIGNDPRNHPLGKNPTDYWSFTAVVGGRGASAEKTRHPCQFPVEMVERIVRACSNPGEIVLDPFGGSGSTAVAALRNGRRAICIEKNSEYHEMAKGRAAGI